MLIIVYIFVLDWLCSSRMITWRSCKTCEHQGRKNQQKRQKQCHCLFLKTFHFEISLCVFCVSFLSALTDIPIIPYLPFPCNAKLLEGVADATIGAPVNLCKKEKDRARSVLYPYRDYLYSGKMRLVVVLRVAYASSRSSSTGSFSSSAITASSFGCVLGWRGVNTVQQSSKGRIDVSKVP